MCVVLLVSSLFFVSERLGMLWGGNLLPTSMYGWGYECKTVEDGDVCAAARDVLFSFFGFWVLPLHVRSIMWRVAGAGLGEICFFFSSLDI